MTTKDDDRRARVAQMQREQRTAEFRRSFLIVGGAFLAGAVIIGVAVVSIVRAQQEKDDVAASAKEPVAGVQEYDDLSRNHDDSGVTYPQNPPVGGDHASVWMNCGSYARPVAADRAVHTLEHGAVWISYQPDLPETEVAVLDELAQRNSYLLVSPAEDLSAPVVLTAWGTQLSVDSAEDARVATFVEKYQEGPQSPEPGAPCTGGVGAM